MQTFITLILTITAILTNPSAIAFVAIAYLSLAYIALPATRAIIAGK